MKDIRGVELQEGQTVVTTRPAGGFGKVRPAYGIVAKVNKSMVRIDDEVEGDSFNKYPSLVVVVSDLP